MHRLRGETDLFNSSVISRCVIDPLQLSEIMIGLLIHRKNYYYYPVTTIKAIFSKQAFHLQ